MKTLISIGLIALVLVAAGMMIVFADEDEFATEGTIKLINPLGTDSTIGDVIYNVLGGLQLIAIPIVAIMILVGGFQILIAGGDPEKFKRGKKTILYVVIGYAIILIASGITSIVKEVLSVPVVDEGNGGE